MVSFVCYVFFFFQAEDGIRDGRVTGVQTCALPICNEIGLPFPHAGMLETVDLFHCCFTGLVECRHSGRHFCRRSGHPTRRKRAASAHVIADGLGQPCSVRRRRYPMSVASPDSTSREMSVCRSVESPAGGRASYGSQGRRACRWLRSTNWTAIHTVASTPTTRTGTPSSNAPLPPMCPLLEPVPASASVAYRQKVSDPAAGWEEVVRQGRRCGRFQRTGRCPSACGFDGTESVPASAGA